MSETPFIKLSLVEKLWYMSKKISCRNSTWQIFKFVRIWWFTHGGKKGNIVVTSLGLRSSKRWKDSIETQLLVLMIVSYSLYSYTKKNKFIN